MATSSSNSFHTRSISLPTRFNPILHQVEECLKAAKGCEAKLHSLKNTGLGHLKDLFCCIDDFLQMANTQKALRRKESFVSQLMDDFLTLLDVCGIVKDSVQQMTEQQQALQSMLRRRDQNLDVGIGRYQCTRKRMRKDMNKCLQLLKSMEVNALSSNDSKDKVDDILRAVRANTVSMFQLLAAIISARSSPRSIFWRLRLPSSKRHDGGDAEENTNEIESLDVALFALCGHSNKALVEDSVQCAQRVMKNLDQCLREVDDELEGVFRCLINVKFTLLNILTCC